MMDYDNVGIPYGLCQELQNKAVMLADKASNSQQFIAGIIGMIVGAYLVGLIWMYFHDLKKKKAEKEELESYRAGKKPSRADK